VEGRPPYDAGTAMATVASVVHDEVPKPSCSGPLAEVISGLMIKDPARRMPLSRVRQLLGAPPEPADPQPLDPESEVRPVPVAGPVAETLDPPRRPTGRLAAAPGPLPFAVPSGSASRSHRSAAAHRCDTTGAQGAGRQVVLWTLAVLLFLGAATAGFGIARLASGRVGLPSLGARAVVGTSPGNLVLAPRMLQATGPDGTRPVRFTVTVPRGWPEFREQRTLGNSSATVARFVSPDGSEVIAVERVTGVLPGGSVDQYLTSYLRTLAQGVRELVETQRQKLSDRALDATFRTREGGELRRTTYLRLIAARADLWAVSVTVPTEREGAGRMRLFEPVVAGFAPGL
jgi:eukaryotic-like serine/threonine-protein kinase